jgi:hypothetical protein
LLVRLGFVLHEAQGLRPDPAVGPVHQCLERPHLAPLGFPHQRGIARQGAFLVCHSLQESIPAPVPGYTVRAKS